MQPALIGREAEGAIIDRFLDGVADGPIALLLSGEAGIGKTEIWADGVRQATQRGQRVLQARAAERERQLAFATLRDLLLDAFSEVSGSLPEPQRDALGAALLLTRADEPVDQRIIGTALGTVLTTLATVSPVVVAIDDAHWLDRASERALEFALRRPPARLGVLVATRAGRGPSPLGLDSAFGRSAVTHLDVGPLATQELRRVIRAAGFDPSSSTFARLASAAGGNPFYALELARAIGSADPPPGEPLPVPAVLADLVRNRVAGLSPAARSVAVTAAALFRPTQVAIERALGGDVDVGAGLVEAEEAGVLEWDGERLRFTHPLIGSALYGGLSVGRRRALHRRLAESAADPEERARHLVGGTVGEDEDAARDIELAARLAERRGAPDAAAELFRVAERLTPPVDVDARARRSLGAASALATAGDLLAARALAREVRAIAASGSLRARASLLEASIASYAGSADEQAAALDAALADAGDDAALRIEILLALAARIAVDPARAARDAEEAVGVSRAAGDAASLGQALVHLVVASAIIGLGSRRDLLDEAAALEKATPWWGVDSLIWSHWIDDVVGARERYEVQLRLAREKGDAIAAAELAEFVAMVDFRAGDWDAAERSLEEACVTLGQVKISGPFIASFADRSVIDAHRGRFDRARGTMRDILAGDPPPDQFWTAVSLSALGAVEFVAGDARAADAAWTAMGQNVRSIGWLDFLEDRSEPDHIEALLALGDRRRAREVLDHLEWRGRTLPRPWIEATLPRARALVAASDGDIETALRMLAEAVPAETVPFERARHLLVKAQLERRANRKLAARRSLEDALAIFEALGSPPWIDRTRAEIGRLGLRHGDRHELTAMERRIAELAATGLTNREVAAAAFVSPKTVEANLARVYGKLGIRSRAELGARMAAGSTTADAET
jgi:DNA-binding CsgD family transcriptional regulator